jgi:hypothetical protein
MMPALHMLRRWWQGLDHHELGGVKPQSPVAKGGIQPIFFWLIFTGTCTMLPLLVLNINAQRHQLDFLPSFILSACFAYGSWLTQKQRDPTQFVAVALVGWGLALLSVFTAVLFALTGYGGRFQKMNPELLRTLKELFPD